MVNVDLFVPFLQRQTRCPVRVVVVAASAARICLPPHSLAAPYAVVSSPHQARVVPTDRSPYGACATAPLAPTACFASRTYARGLAVQHLVSQIAVVSCRLASLHSLTALVRRRTVQFPPADHSGRSRLALMPYLIFVCCPGISATRPEASPYRTPLPERSKLGSGGSLVRGSPLHLLLPMWATRPAAPYRTPLLEGSKLGSNGSLVRGSVAPRLLPMRTRPRDQQGQRR